jgi:hypothetical protein
MDRHDPQNKSQTPMTMSTARLSARSGLSYLLKTTMMDDLTVTPADAAVLHALRYTPTNASLPPKFW